MCYLLPSILFAAETTFFAAKLSDQIMGKLIRMIIRWKQLSPLLVFDVTFATSFITFFNLAQAHLAENAATLKQCRLAGLTAAIVMAACTAAGHLITRWWLNNLEVEQEVVEEEDQGAGGAEPMKRGPGC